ncbi:hypothetical protein EBP22_17050 [Salmonella enterica subsp. enterica serovar Typhimurium]|nr:hypothetical protein [Citrobacter portucalensis]EBZ5074294.1 hypothetical protein [Salmonella enterica subsp. enterica serovar Typhimurium]EEB8458239.1 hypothetical protein [Salmonella enterica]ECL7522378.1 hypothetical protein [Salmonella enterica subsp. enterica serovar Typhimurium]EDN3714080.1 hypothetical protein [Salmonella enterica subsp. enterica serovar Typhimurium]EEF6236507.1 hypothetical protein [Salmonella enterica]
MKTVTVDSVRARLSFLEGLNARGVGMAVPQQQFEIACLRELLALLVCRPMPVTVKLSADNAAEPMTAITRERLLKIQSWRETYGPGSNIVLPAEEAEELARIALASLDAEKNKCCHSALDNEDGVITCRSCGKEWNI